MTNNLGAPTTTSPPASGPGGNPIVPTPATPNEWWKMLMAIGIVAGGIWVFSNFNEDGAIWLAIIILGAIITYYETNGNNQFSSGITDLAKLAGIG